MFTIYIAKKAQYKVVCVSECVFKAYFFLLLFHSAIIHSQRIFISLLFGHFFIVDGMWFFFASKMNGRGANFLLLHQSNNDFRNNVTIWKCIGWFQFGCRWKKWFIFGSVQVATPKRKEMKRNEMKEAKPKKKERAGIFYFASHSNGFQFSIISIFLPLI